MVHLLLKEHQTGTRRFDALLRRSIRACYLMLWLWLVCKQRRPKLKVADVVWLQGCMDVVTQRLLVRSFVFLINVFIMFILLHRLSPALLRIWPKKKTYPKLSILELLHPNFELSIIVKGKVGALCYEWRCWRQVSWGCTNVDCYQGL